MRCDEATTHLDDYIDGCLEKATAKALEAHLAACPACREEERALRALVEQAGALPLDVAPERDLWPGIRSRIAFDRDSMAGGRRRHRVWSALVYALPVAAVITVVTAIGLGGWRDGTAPGGGDLDAIDQHYLAAKEELLNALREQEDSLSPETVATVEANLAIIEEAVGEIQMALAEHPDNPHLERMLIAAYQSELSLLHQMVRLAGTG